MTVLQCMFTVTGDFMQSLPGHSCLLKVKIPVRLSRASREMPRQPESSCHQHQSPSAPGCSVHSDSSQLQNKMAFVCLCLTSVWNLQRLGTQVCTHHKAFGKGIAWNATHCSASQGLLPGVAIASVCSL